jgi:hypothetical protein
MPNIITSKQRKRFAWMKTFVSRNHRWPTGLELRKKYHLKSSSTAWEAIEKYKAMLGKCPVCQHPLS